MIESSSPADILFLLTHPVIERLLAAKRLSTVSTMNMFPILKWPQVDGNNEFWVYYSFYNFKLVNEKQFTQIINRPFPHPFRNFYVSSPFSFYYNSPFFFQLLSSFSSILSFVMFYYLFSVPLSFFNMFLYFSPPFFCYVSLSFSVSLSYLGLKTTTTSALAMQLMISSHQSPPSQILSNIMLIQIRMDF